MARVSFFTKELEIFRKILYNIDKKTHYAKMRKAG
jgi:hypothetical protein